MADEPKTDAEKMAKIDEIITDVHIAMLTTEDKETGGLRSRPMAYQHPKGGFDGTIYFFTDASSGKVDEIDKEHQVNVAFSNPKDNDYVSISGTAILSRDHEKITELWNPMYKAWFPDGLEDPNLALLVVTTNRAEYWASPNGALLHVFGVVKAAVTGTRMTSGEHESIG